MVDAHRTLPIRTRTSSRSHAALNVCHFGAPAVTIAIVFASSSTSPFTDHNKHNPHSVSRTLSSIPTSFNGIQLNTRYIRRNALLTADTSTLLYIYSPFCQPKGHTSLATDTHLPKYVLSRNFMYRTECVSLLGIFAGIEVIPARCLPCYSRMKHARSFACPISSSVAVS